jgi:hypothetical protein
MRKLLVGLALALIATSAGARGAARGRYIGSGCMDVSIDSTGSSFSVIFIMKPPTLTSQGWTCERQFLPDVADPTIETAGEKLLPTSVHAIPRAWQNAYGARWETTDTVAAFAQDKVRTGQGIFITANGGIYSVKFKAAEVERAMRESVR